MSKKILILIVDGFLIGIANAIPGVSGGTIAFMLGIYEKLIDSIKLFDSKFFKLIINFNFKVVKNHIPWEFLLSISFGALIAIVSFSRILVWMIKNTPILINSFFFGLILATVPIVFKSLKKVNALNLLIVAVVSIATYFFVEMVPLKTPDSLWFILFCGAVSITAMILPGISGSFILLLLGKYFYIMNAIIEKDLIVLSVFLTGAVLGVAVFVRFLSWLFHKHHDFTISVLTGFVIGSLNKIWPWKKVIESVLGLNGKLIVIKETNIFPEAFTIEVFVALSLILVGFLCSMLIERFSSHPEMTLRTE